MLPAWGGGGHGFCMCLHWSGGGFCLFLVGGGESLSQLGGGCLTCANSCPSPGLPQCPAGPGGSCATLTPPLSLGPWEHTEQHQALAPAKPPLCHPLSVCSFPIQLCLSVCVPSVCPPPQLPRALPSPVPTLGCPLSLCPHEGRSTGVGTPHGRPSQWGWAHLSPPTLGRCWGGPGVAALPTPPALPAWAGGGSGVLSSAAAKTPPPVVCLSFPFFAGGNSVSLPAKCFETHLPRCLPPPGPGSWAPPPPQPS